MSFTRKLNEVMDSTKEPWELLLVDDGSTDGSTEMIRELAAKDARVKPVIFSRNFGHQIAVTAGLDYSRGDAVMIIDADLQDPPEVILDLIRKWKEGYQVVYAVRTEREGESWFKRTTASAFYRLIYRITDIKIPLDTGDFRLMDRKVVDALKKMGERHRFLRGMSSWVGFRQVGVGYKRAARYSGETKYPFRKMVKLASECDHQFFLFSTATGHVCRVYCCRESLSWPSHLYWLQGLQEIRPFLGQASTLMAVLFLGGVQLICIGILGEYIGRIYDEVKGRPLYIVSEAPGDVENKLNRR